jgi:hypothetical protein
LIRLCGRCGGSGKVVLRRFGRFGVQDALRAEAADLLVARFGVLIGVRTGSTRGSSIML